MNKDGIRNTAVCRWDVEHECFIVQSPLYEALKGISDNKDEAWEIFDDFLDDAHKSYLEGRLGGTYARAGRPAKNRTALSCQVGPNSLEKIKSLANDLSVSQGEAIDFLLAHYRASKTMERKRKADVDALFERQEAHTETSQASGPAASGSMGAVGVPLPPHYITNPLRHEPTTPISNVASSNRRKRREQQPNPSVHEDSIVCAIQKLAEELTNIKERLSRLENTNSAKKSKSQ